MHFLDIACWLVAAYLALQVLFLPFARADVPKFRIIDGDTFELHENKEKIRIRGVDTLELTDKNPKNKKLALEAKAELERMMNKGYSINRTSKDRYGRTVAEVDLNGIDAADYLVKKGLGKPYIYKLKKDKVEQLLKLQKQAKNNKVGIWAK